MGEALKNYESGGQIFLGSRLLAEITKATVRDIGNLNKVYTTIQGLAGTAAGPLEAEIMIEEAMPKSGAEYDFANALRTRQVLILRVRSEGVSESYSMRVADTERQFDANAAAIKTINFIGKLIGTTT